MIARLFHAWERRLAYTDDGERQVLPFEWGDEFLPRFSGWGHPGPVPKEHERRRLLHEHVERALAASGDYFALPGVPDYHFGDDDVLTYPSPAPTGVAENDRVQAKLYRAKGLGSAGRGPAAVVLPHWNAKEGAQDGLCRLMTRFGLSALKLTLPYHEARRAPGHLRADFTLSPNVGRTIQSCRQAVLDARAAAAWLLAEGYGPLGIVGTSLGSAIAFVVYAHEAELSAAVFNHVSPYFADVVWRGISTRQVREGLARGIDLDELRKLWLPLSPFAYYERLKKSGRPSLLVYGRYDLSFPPDLSKELLRDFRKLEIEHEAFELPCGHYTTAKFPFNWIDGLTITRFLARRLGSA